MRFSSSSDVADMASATTTVSDNPAGGCRASDKQATLPSYARLPLNRCNLPAVILGGLTFQAHPVALMLDGVQELHAPFFSTLDAETDRAERGRRFVDYLTVLFRLDQLEDAGFGPTSTRGRANWRRLLRGWSFDADGLEAAALKGWVESRFGLLPRFHGGPLRDYNGAAWHRYEEMRARALYGANALEAQLDLLYAYCQYEYARAGAASGSETLYRGVNRLADHEVLGEGATDESGSVVLFNNLSSFSASRERAGEFGDHVLEVTVPSAKVFFHCQLLPGLLRGEDEFLVLGGVYRVRQLDF